MNKMPEPKYNIFGEPVAFNVDDLPKLEDSARKMLDEVDYTVTMLRQQGKHFEAQLYEQGLATLAQYTATKAFGN